MLERMTAKTARWAELVERIGVDELAEPRRSERAGWAA